VHGSTRSKGRSGGSRGLLDGTSVVILVTSQGRPACKGLLAVGVWALVRSLSRVDTSMSGKGARVAERLVVESVHVGRKYVLSL